MFGSIEKRLSELGDQIREATDELAALAEQTAFFEEAADDKRLAALVAETPIADSEARSAGRTADAHRQELKRLEDHIEKLHARQDELLEELSKRVAE